MHFILSLEITYTHSLTTNGKVGALAAAIRVVDYFTALGAETAAAAAGSDLPT